MIEPYSALDITLYVIGLVVIGVLSFTISYLITKRGMKL